MVLAIIVPPVAVALVVFYFLRSSKEMPKNWREFKLELKIQASGTQGLAEDTVMRIKNKVGEFSNQFQITKKISICLLFNANNYLIS